MSAKRALVVDDSRSARAFLARILERHEITVDAAESAEAAIEYLARNKPDVIFMDHMMPGMDGFQAVQSIKNNPRTSSIPILMYTSQEGDLYLGQARALGAEGVLPKQIKQADVTRILYELRLVADRRGDDQTTYSRMSHAPDMMPANESAIVVTPRADPAPGAGAASGAVGSAEAAQLLPQMSLEIRAALDGPLQTELKALRSFISSALDSQTERLQGDLLALAPQPRAATLDMPTMVSERRRWPAIVAGCLALLATAGAALLGWLWWQQGGELAAARSDLVAAYAEVDTLRARAEVVSQQAAAETAASPADPAALIPAEDALDAPAADATAVTPEVTAAPVSQPAAAAIPAAPTSPVAVSAAVPPAPQAQ
jgi:CheY-like chemotaxis protein